MPSLSPEHADFLEGPNTVIVASRGDDLVPEITRGIAVRCDAPRGRITVWLPAFATPELVAHLRANGAIAVSCSQLRSHRALQVKGRVIAIRDPDGPERAAVDRACSAFADECQTLGLPRRVVERAAWVPALAVDVEVSDVFEQTPGPGAGARYPRGRA